MRSVRGPITASIAAAIIILAANVPVGRVDGFATSFVARGTASAGGSLSTHAGGRCFARRTKKKNEVAEFTIEEEDDDDDEEEWDAGEEAGEKSTVDDDEQDGDIRVDDRDDESDDDDGYYYTDYRYVALLPGTVVQVQVGDIRSGRKAWKKRRRSGSPLLVPCSVLNVDRRSSVLWNLVYLLEKFGTPDAAYEAALRVAESSRHPDDDNDGKAASAVGVAGTHRSGPGVAISLRDLAERHRSHLKSSLKKHAAELGYGSSSDLVRSLFKNRMVQDSYGVNLVIAEGGGGGDDDGEDEVWLQAPVSRFKAQKRAGAAAIAQFCHQHRRHNEDDDDDGNRNHHLREGEGDGGIRNHHDDIALVHTGAVRNRRTSGNDGDKLYKLQPLSAALRVSQRDDIDSGVVSDGSKHAAVVFDYDVAGDAGAPLLTLSLNPARNQVRDRLKLVPSSLDVAAGGGGDSKDAAAAADASLPYDPVVRNARHRLRDLRLGDGPMKGRIVRLVKGGALVDCDVGRESKRRRGRGGATAADDDDDENDGGALIRVLGLLRFKDAVPDTDPFEDGEDGDDVDLRAPGGGVKDEDEEDDWDSIITVDGEDDDDEEEVTEDITHLFETKDDGSLVYHDPETGESKVVLSSDDEDEEEEFSRQRVREGKDDDDDAAGSGTAGRRRKRKNRSRESRVSASSILNDDPSTSWSSGGRRGSGFRTKTLRVGDVVNVYVRSVSKQSGQLRFTTDAGAVRDRTASDVKRENEISKKLSRLSKQLGGLHRIRDLRGREMDGVVRATSNTGDWLYVQPVGGNDDGNDGGGGNDLDLPVGVASVAADVLNDDEITIGRGDSVRIQLDGIDENRGQLAMKVLRKLSP